jgi:hypothetical protein
VAGLLGVAAPALATSYLGTGPPSGADRGGLLRAFHHVHHAYSHPRLVGFRVCCTFGSDQTPQSAAAYYLTTGADGSYGAAVVELYRRRSGNSWVHVARFKNTTPDFNDVYNLGPGFLWKVIGTGAGTDDYQSTATATDGSSTDTYKTLASFSWNLVFGRGRPLQLSDGESYGAKRSLEGQASATVSYSDNSTPNTSCAGAIRDTGGDQSPDMSFAAFPHEGRTKALDFTIDLVGGLSWPSGCNSDTSVFPEDDRFVVGARMPIAVALRTGIYNPGGDIAPALHTRPFSYPVDDLDPQIAAIAKPHQSSSETDGGTIYKSTEDFKLAGALRFKLVGLWMPLGLDGGAQPPVRADGGVPPVL